LQVWKLPPNFNSIGQRVQKLHRSEYFTKIQYGRLRWPFWIFVKKIKMYIIALAGMKTPTTFHFDRSTDSKVKPIWTFCSNPRWPPAATKLDFCKKNGKHSPYLYENSHQISIRSLNGFKRYIHLNILQDGHRRGHVGFM
jgi:hypothetical protein